MEPLGLALGAVGVADVFSTLLQVAGQVQDYRSYDADSKVLNAHFNAVLLRLERWGDSVGIAAGQIPATAPHPHPGGTRGVVLEVKDLLMVAAEALNANDSNVHARAAGHNQRSSSSSSKRQRFGWSLRGKLEFKEKVQLFAFTVDELYKLVPIPDNKPTIAEEQIIQSLEASSQELARLIGLVEEIKEDRPVKKADVQSLVRGWLYGQAPSSENFNKFNECLQEKLDGTCEWILEHPTFAEWLDKKPGLLWLNGHAGFGKTILCAHITHHIRRILRRPAVFFFLRILSIKLDAILIVDGLDECIAPTRGTGSVSSIIHDLRGSMTGETRLLITSRDTDAIRRAVMGTAGVGQTTELVLTPRHLHADNMAVAMAMVEAKYPGSKKPEDIKKTLATKLAIKCAGQMQWLKLQTAPLDQARNHLQVENLIDHTPSKIFDCYESIWNKISVQPNKREIIALLRWVAFAKRPLTLGELSEAVLIDDESGQVLLDELTDEAVDHEYLESVFPDLGQLLKLHKEPQEFPYDWTVACNHFTVNEFLSSHLPVRTRPEELNYNRMQEVPCPQSSDRLQSLSLARGCLIYLQLPAVIGSIAERETDQRNNFSGYLEDYAMHAWYQHIGPEAEDIDGATQSLILDFMSPMNPAWKSWTLKFNAALTDEESLSLPNPWTVPRSEGVLVTLDASHLYLHDVGNPHVWHGHKATLPEKLTHIAAGPMHYSVLFRLTSILECQARLKGPAYQCSLARFSALHFAAEWPHLPSVKILLEQGTYADLPSDEGTPLHVAAASGNLAVVNYLLQRGADPSGLTTSLRPPLCLAAQDGHLEIVRLLVKHDSAIIETTKYDDGIRDMAFEIVSNVKASDLFWDRAKHDQAVKVIKHGLLEGGSDHPHGNIFDAIRDHSLLLTKLLLEQGATLLGTGADMGQTPLHAAAYLDDGEILEALLDHRRCVQNIDVQDHEGRTALFIACQYSGPWCVEQLVKAGARCDIADQEGRLPIHIVQFSGKEPFSYIEALRAADGRLYGLDCQDMKGFTPLHHLASRRPSDTNTTIEVGHLKAAEALLLAGAQPDVIYSLGRSALHLAASAGNHAVVKAILEFCAIYRSQSFMLEMINKTDFLGRTPLFLASCSPWNEEFFLLWRGNFELLRSLPPADTSMMHGVQRIVKGTMVSVFISFGADVHKTNCFGMSPLEAAVLRGERDAVCLLAAAGADMNPEKPFLGIPLRIWARKFAVGLAAVASKRGASLNTTPVDLSDDFVRAIQESGEEGYVGCDACLLFVHRTRVSGDGDVTLRYLQTLRKRAKTLSSRRPR
ncbi:ankyrin repeats (3 copies) domain-containing protein [Sarocladium implicatum]|nr:ankyrin repeats (3 copies) domain-containing protein [Sarocladium implicatum]